MSFLILQNSCQSSGFVVFFAFLYNFFFVLHIFFQVFIEQGKGVSGSCKTDWYIVFHNVDDLFFVTRFHLSLTVMFWFREKYLCVKSSRDF